MGKVLNNKVLLFIVAILLLANISMLIFFLGMKHTGKNARSEKDRSPISVFLEKEIGFDKQQMEQVEKLRQEHRQKIRPLFENNRSAKVQFYGLLKNTMINDSDLNQKASAIGEGQKALDLQAFQHFRDIRNLCTEEQKPKYDSLIPGVIGKMWFPLRKTNPRKKDDNQK